MGERERTCDGGLGELTCVAPSTCGVGLPASAGLVVEDFFGGVASGKQEGLWARFFLSAAKTRNMLGVLVSESELSVSSSVRRLGLEAPAT